MSDIGIIDAVEKVKTSDNNITVIGVGKLGLGFALLLENIGYNVMGVDIFPEYVKQINDKTLSSLEPGYNELLQSSKNFTATIDFTAGLEFSDTIFIIVQTPNSGGQKFYDHQILSNVLSKINRLKPQNKDIIVGCTVMPKYIDEVGSNLLSDCVNCTLSYNPEFVAQGDIIKGFQYPDIILLGTTNTILENKLRILYTKMCKNTPKFCFMKPLDSELVKISLNGFITTKISFSNMISDLCDNIGADKFTVLDAIGSDSRIGNKYFRPGFSFGGPCFPRDTKALKQLMDQNGIVSTLLAATTEYNEEHVKFQANQILSNAESQGEQISFVFEGVCYKENSKIPLIEESAKLKIANIIKQKGKSVVIRDKAITIEEVKKEYGNIFRYEITDDEGNNIPMDITETKIPEEVTDIDKLDTTVSKILPEHNMDISVTNNNATMDDVYSYWNNRPCNIKHSDKEIGTKEYFQEVTARKYFVEPHILEFADFQNCKELDVLEVGCGIGTAAQSFIENGANYIGIDVSDYSVDLARKRFELFKLSGGIYAADIEKVDKININYTNELSETASFFKLFDLVYSFGVLHHIPNIELSISNIYKLLKPGGVFKLMLYAKDSYKYKNICNGTDQFEANDNVPIANTYTKTEVNNLLKDFVDIQIKQTHIFPYKIEEYKKYNYVKEDFFENMSLDEFKTMETVEGWHLCITCRKPT